MKIAKVLITITLNGILPWSFPVRHLAALFPYLLNPYDHSFLTAFIISELILNIFQTFCFSSMLFLDAPKITPKSFTFFSIWYITWCYPIYNEFCIHLLLIKIKDSTLSKLFNSLLISSYFRTFYKHPFLQLLNHSFQTLFSRYTFHLVHLILHSSSPLTSLSENVDYLYTPLNYYDYYYYYHYYYWPLLQLQRLQRLPRLVLVLVLVLLLLLLLLWPG